MAFVGWFAHENWVTVKVVVTFIIINYDSTSEIQCYDMGSGLPMTSMLHCKVTEIVESNISNLIHSLTLKKLILHEYYIIDIYPPVSEFGLKTNYSNPLTLSCFLWGLVCL